jgi:hypothetical protein
MRLTRSLAMPINPSPKLICMYVASPFEYRLDSLCACTARNENITTLFDGRGVLVKQIKSY